MFAQGATTLVFAALTKFSVFAFSALKPTIPLNVRQILKASFIL
jgi:hypothetical protein